MKHIQRALRRLATIKVLGVRKYGEVQEQDDGATLAATRVGIQALLDVMYIEPGVASDTLDAEEIGPENSREEVVGTSTQGKSANFSNTGFGGGCMMAA